MAGPRGAFVLVALQLLGGTFSLMWLAQLRWKFINRGYFRSTTWVLWPLTAALIPVMSGRLRLLTALTAGAMVMYLVALYSQRPLLEWTTGAVATAGAVWITLQAGYSGCLRPCWHEGNHSLAGLVLLGAVTHAMALGHWYLNQARLPIEPLAQHTWLMIFAIVLSAILGLVTRPRLVEGTVPGGIFAFSGSSLWWTWLFLLAATAGLAAMIMATVRQRATQSATGLLYIAIVTALGAQFALDLLVLS